MTIEEFYKTFYLTYIKSQLGSDLLIRTELVDRKVDKTIDAVETRKNIHDLNDWIRLSQSAYSITPWTLDQVLNDLMRAHFDHFCRIIPVINFYPLDVKSNPDITKYYLPNHG